MKRIFLAAIACFVFVTLTQGQTLQTVTNSGDTTTNLIRITGANMPITLTGPGLEMGYQNATGFVQTFHRSSGAWLPLTLRGSTITTSTRTLINGATDDGSTALQVNGGASLTKKLYIDVAIEGNNVFTYGSHLELHNSRYTGGLAMSIGQNNSGLIQAYSSSAMDGSLLLNPNGGKVGIGTASPDQVLTIKGGGIGFDGTSSDKKLYSPADGTLEWYTNNNAGEHGFAISHQGTKQVYLSSYGDSYLMGGNVGIGTKTPQSQLAVNGTITATKIKVTATGWPDFVFDEQYQLPTLQEVESYIKANKHLPAIPGAAEVGKEGQDLGAINEALLQKVEELTLYIIQQQKQMDAMDARLKAVEKQ
ncbi:hypothetical protein SIO70_06940 [Chitinophaga sancti]|uniref:hypothetical protein n=1 Tax=Chitinophaga sancti TaxID=1004 RepID=UPI002A762DBC|nr:hypothetical protein [Chitinophaga sancti]WPQ64601.1 hypothetical protein SIO70_06940 [Chitinophaga sancti]